jgi:hypothetical protein
MLSRQKADCHDRLLMADCQNPPPAANWKSDRRADADGGDLEVTPPALRDGSD